eukprot:CAMPEP_0168366814 /NCGR_PEP_ID=MMETSP0228-20121227/5415_1 /TAXON_ID=133427 /ORGANISM="Protoceratium reticulatum, Strain CCCM 535 (=CCMP 1889)" /LENGTH=40 /DNA_ID= /DNA_START= /DNA_END= /DNA_ORIENTATION=
MLELAQPAGAWAVGIQASDQPPRARSKVVEPEDKEDKLDH